MARLSAQERLATLQKKAAQLAAQVDKAKAVMKSDERKRDDRRKIIIGALVIDLLAKKTPLPKSMDGFLQLLTRDNDRLPFDGWTVNDDKPGSPQ